VRAGGEASSARHAGGVGLRRTFGADSQVNVFPLLLSSQALQLVPGISKMIAASTISLTLQMLSAVVNQAQGEFWRLFSFALFNPKSLISLTFLERSPTTRLSFQPNFPSSPNHQRGAEGSALGAESQWALLGAILSSYA
jgi:hypothetical protein